MLWHQNLNVDKITTPVKADILKKLLKESNYPDDKTEFLVKGFREGFLLGYEGPRVDIRREAKNLRLRIGSQTELWNKVMKEMELGRYASPFETPPFENYIQSPVWLVPKDGGQKTHLIFHLSYPRNGQSVNSEIPKEKCSVSYPDFDSTIKLCQRISKHSNWIFWPRLLDICLLKFRTLCYLS